MEYLAGIDLGTSSVKVLITDLSGKLLGCGNAGYEIQIPKAGYAEQEPSEWWESTKTAIRLAVNHARISPEKILGIGFSGQMHGMVALDAAGSPVCPAMIHLDQRSVKERERILETAQDLMAAELLNQPGAGMLICSLLWLKNNRPAAYEKIHTVMLPKDYIRYRLTGRIGSDYTDASSTLAFSVRRTQWCMPLIERLGLKTDIWPEIKSPFAVAGTVTPKAAEETGLSPMTKVVMGGGDSAMALIGNGIVREGTMACNIGTASQIAAVVHQPKAAVGMKCQIWNHPVPNTWYMQGGTLNGCNTINWLRDKILRSSASFQDLDRGAAEIPAGSDHLIFIPFLAGERTPFMDPYAKGVYFGLGMNHDQRHVFRATMEGVLYNLCECAKIFREAGISSEKLIFSGGGAKSAVWRQIAADVLNQPVYTTETEEEAGMGAVIMAAVGTGCYSSVEEACGEIIRIAPEPIQPIAENVEIYSEQQALFSELYHHVKDIFPKLQYGNR